MFSCLKNGIGITDKWTAFQAAIVSYCQVLETVWMSSFFMNYVGTVIEVPQIILEFTVLISAPKSIQLVFECLAKPLTDQWTKIIPRGRRHKTSRWPWRSLLTRPAWLSWLSCRLMCDWENPVDSISVWTSLGADRSWQISCKRAGSLSSLEKALISASCSGVGVDEGNLWLVSHQIMTRSIEVHRYQRVGFRELSVLAVRLEPPSRFQLAASLPEVAPACFCLVAAIFVAVATIFCLLQKQLEVMRIAS